MSQRVKGQEIEISLIVDQQVQTSLTDVKSFEVTTMFEIKQEGYLGETSDRFDEYFKGVKGRMEINFEEDGIFTFFTKILDRAQRRDPNVVVNVKATFNFPNGDKPRVMLQDLFFGDMPINFASRGDYGTMAIEFSCSQVSVL